MGFNGLVDSIIYVKGKANCMKPYLNTMLEKVPENIRLDTQEYISEHIAVFEPNEYATGQKVCFDHYHFVILLSAPPIFRVGRKEYQFEKGSLLSFGPGMDLTVLPFSKRVMGKYVSISVSKDFFQSIALEAVGKEEIGFKRLENIYSRQLMNLIENFKYELINYGNVYPKMVQSIGTQVAFQLLRDVNVDTAAHRRSLNEHSYINNAIEYMESNYSCDISINDISNAVYVSPAHFDRMFKCYTGQTPHQYLLGIRIEKAKEKIKRDECSIEEAARLCGFINPGHFSTAFKRIIGVSPSEYRRKNINSRK